MQCPICRIPGFVVEYQGVELDLCPECCGIWFDRGELELVLDSEQPMNLVPATSEEDRRRCPICRNKMDKVNIGPGRRVLIDTCPKGCGLWFDKGELKELTGNLQEEGWSVAPEIRDFLGEMFPEKDNKPDVE